MATSAYLPVDVSAVQSKSDILKGAKLEVLSFGSGSRSKEAISKLIKELGGQVRRLSGIMHHKRLITSTTYRKPIFVSLPFLLCSSESLSTSAVWSACISDIR